MNKDDNECCGVVCVVVTTPYVSMHDAATNEE